MASNNLTLFPLSNELPSRDDALISSADYYSVFLEAACVTQGDNFFVKNDVSLNVTMTIGSNKIQTQVYADYVPGTQGKIGANHPLLLSYIPCNGDPLSLGVSFIRTDKHDFIPKLLSILTGAQGSPEMTKYAATAIPYVQLAGAVGNDVYDLLVPDHGQKFVETVPGALTPSSGRADRFDLRDCYMLQYFGPDNPPDSELTVDSGDVRWSGGNKSRFRSGPWVLFRIKKYKSRPDQHERSWDQKFQSALVEFSGRPGTDPSKADKEFSDAVVLLRADKDFTEENKEAIEDAYNTAFQKAKANQHHPAFVSALFDSTRLVHSNSTEFSVVDPLLLSRAISQFAG